MDLVNNKCKIESLVLNPIINRVLEVKRKFLEITLSHIC
jgi:hypothetical protein